WNGSSTARAPWSHLCARTAAGSPNPARSTDPRDGTGSSAASYAMTPETGRAVPWSRGQKVGLAAILGLGVLVRIVLLPTQGVRGDLDQFVLWVHGIAVNGLPQASDQ